MAGSSQRIKLSKIIAEIRRDNGAGQTIRRTLNEGKTTQTRNKGLQMLCH